MIISAVAVLIWLGLVWWHWNDPDVLVTAWYVMGCSVAGILALSQFLLRKRKGDV